MSHVKNMQAFGKLTGICTGYGGQYNPGQQNLQVDAMTTLMISAQQVMDACNEAQALYDQVTNARERGFKGLRRLSSSVCLVLKSSGVDPATVADAYRLNRRIWGARKAMRKENAAAQATGEKPKVFVYGLDYASLANHFARLVELVLAEPMYRPTEANLSVEGLQQKLGSLLKLNAAVTEAEIRVTHARRERNRIFYQMEGNLFATAMASKQYIRGVFGFQSSQHQEVRQLRFNKPPL